MAYTVKKLAQISGVSIRTLHFYDEIGLLKPAYHGSNGYRYYEEPQLLLLQQILFFRELGFELKQIQQMVTRGDFNKLVTLTSHRQVLQKNLERIKQLIETIDQTINHLKGTTKMKDPRELYYGFSKEQQKQYETQLIERFGVAAKVHIDESHQNVKNWSQADWVRSKKEFTEVCQALSGAIANNLSPDSKEVQAITKNHYLWLKRFWTPVRDSYAGYGQFIADSNLRLSYEVYHPQLPEFIAKAIQVFAKNELS
jgi:DNA-binding transcriptional MerR regulator